MWKKIILLALIGLSATGCAFTPSQLNTNPARFNGITVVVRGFVKVTSEVHVLYESQAIDAEVQRGLELGGPGFDVRKYERYCITIANPELLYKNSSSVNARTIIVQGRFTDDYRIGKRVDLGACLLPTAIIIDDVALARRYPSLLPQK